MDIREVEWEGVNWCVWLGTGTSGGLFWTR